MAMLPTAAAQTTETQRYVAVDGIFPPVPSCVIDGPDVASTNGACFQVPDQASSLDLMVDDATGLQVTFILNFLDDQGDVLASGFHCGSFSAAIPSGTTEISVFPEPAWAGALAAAGLADFAPGDCDERFATTGTITATFA